MNKITPLMLAAVAGLLTHDTIAQDATPPKGPVKVFLLSGQSNMTGRGRLGSLSQSAVDQKATLVRFIKEPENLDKYKFLYEGKNKDTGGWTIRDDVFISYGAWPDDPKNPGAKHGGLAPGYGGRAKPNLDPNWGSAMSWGSIMMKPSCS
jgi:hypothetical protein